MISTMTAKANSAVEARLLRGKIGLPIGYKVDCENTFERLATIRS